MLSNGSHRTCHELSTLFADSLASTLHDWLDFATGLSVLVYPHSHSIDAGSGIEHSTSCADDVGGVGVDKLDKEEIVDKPVPLKQLVLLVIIGASLLVEEVHVQFSQIFFEPLWSRSPPSR